MDRKILEEQEDFNTASSLLKKTIPELVERRIPPTPQNYTLWYLFAKKADEVLTQMLETNFHTPGDYSPSKSAKFFRDFVLTPLSDIKASAGGSETSQTRVVLERLVTALFRKSEHANKTTVEYAQSLDHALNVIENPESPEQLEEVMSKLLADTHGMSKITKDFQRELQKTRKELFDVTKRLKVTQEEARIDGLTKLLNRKTFDTVYQEWFDNKDEPLCVAFLDLDHFKNVNDTHGHQVGDRVLELVGAVLKKVESADVVAARYGGEELVLLIRRGPGRAEHLANFVKTSVAAIDILQKNEPVKIPHVTVSIGLAERQETDDAKSLLERADQCVYYAKSHGRNQVSTTPEF